MAAVLRFVTLLAVLLMPFGMAAAPAAPAVEHHASAAMPMEHCPEAPKSDLGGGPADCAMPCSAALPVAEIHVSEMEPMARTPGQPSVEPRLAGVLMEIATPPPKTA